MTPSEIGKPLPLLSYAWVLPLVQAMNTVKEDTDVNTGISVLKA
jgi:hypothetical protein